MTLDGMHFEAGSLARSWLSVGIASSADKSRPALDRTVVIETFPEGIRLVATDSYVLLHAFVRDIDHELAPEPGLDEKPIATAVAQDPDGRARGLMAYLNRLANDVDAGAPEVLLRVGAFEVDERSPSFDGLEAHWVVIEVPDQERLTLQVYDGAFPTWRGLLHHFRGEDTAAIAFGPDVVGRLAQLGKIHKGSELVWRFGGHQRMALFELGHADPAVEGAVMPVRTPLIVDDRPEPPLTPAEDDLLWPAAQLVVESALGSASMLQRRLAIGFARASRLIDQLERRGIVGPATTTRARDVLITHEELDALLAEHAPTTTSEEPDTDA